MTSDGRMETKKRRLLIRGLVSAAAVVACSGDRNKEHSPPRPTAPVVAEQPEQPTRVSKSKPVTPSVCATIRKAIETRNPSAWNGLPAECKAIELFDGIPADVADRPRRLLGTRTATWVILQLGGYYRPKASFVDGAFVMFDAMNPELAVKGPELLKEFGAPAARENWWYGTLEMKRAAYVYPKRGITLFMNSETGRVLHVALYHPTNLAGWNSQLRPRLRKKLK